MKGLSIAVTAAIVLCGAYFLWKEYGQKIGSTEPSVAESVKEDAEEQNESVAIELDSIIREEIDIETVAEETTATQIDIEDIVSAAIVETNDLGLKAVSGCTFTMNYEGEQATFRLIGLKNTGSAATLQYYIDKLVDPQIEFDNVKVKDDVYQVYLWDGAPDSEKVGNMINLQMIINGDATTTYMNTQDSLVEVPNNKYSTTFIKFQKIAN